ncbi:MAG: exodeoxyribonuclease VII large subunit [Methanoregula sp.]|jgi:exodeoxyribonuclease VII large subunit
MDWFNRTDVADIVDTPYRVSELSAIIEGLLDIQLLRDIQVRGEITNYTHHSRGHRYFSLSEKGGGNTAAVIKCVMWRSDAENLSFDPTEGMEVIVAGTVRVYAPHGSYQLQVTRIKKAGIGEKFLLIERWKKELAAEGCFNLDRKRALPLFPSKIGVVTSKSGAVIHDIRTVVERRYPIEIIISPTSVQGEEAHREIASAIACLAGMVDVIIVARGGGSFEDLFPFNHPDVVRAIVSCPVPVVSAIGHEVDVTLSDLAADLRAATPSAAAELVVPDRKILIARLKDLKNVMSSIMQTRIGREKGEITDLLDRLRPLRFARKLEEKKQNIADLSDRLERAFATRLERERLLLAGMKTALEGRNPLAVLSRGYCMAEKAGKIVKSVTDLDKGDRINIRFHDGRSDMTVERVEHG